MKDVDDWTIELSENWKTWRWTMGWWTMERPDDWTTDG
jgi:hypothetical protein